VEAGLMKNHGVIGRYNDEYHSVNESLIAENIIV